MQILHKVQWKLRIQQVFREQLIKHTKFVNGIHKHFKTDWTSADNNKHTERPLARTTPESINEIQQFIYKHSTTDFHNKIESGMCQLILPDGLQLCCIMSKFVLRLLTPDQKQYQINACMELWQFILEDKSFLSREIPHRVRVTFIGVILKLNSNFHNGNTQVH